MFHRVLNMPLILQLFSAGSRSPMKFPDLKLSAGLKKNSSTRIVQGLWLPIYMVTKTRGTRKRRSNKMKTCRTKCDPGYKKIYRRKNICSETSIKNVQNENIHRCVTYIYILRQKVLYGKKLRCKSYWCY